MEFLSEMNDLFKVIEEYTPEKKRKVLIMSDDTIPDMVSDKKLYPVVTELFIRYRKLSLSLVFITKSHFLVPKHIRQSSSHAVIMKILNR